MPVDRQKQKPPSGQLQDLHHHTTLTSQVHQHTPFRLQRARLLPSIGLRPQEILELQRMIGNRATQHMLRPARRQEAQEIQRQTGPLSVLSNATSSQPTPLPFRSELENTFGRSFAHVQAHVGKEHELSALGVYAAASGNQVVFRSPTPSKALVAHELAHIVQQDQAGGSAAVQGKPLTGQPGDVAEQEADRAAIRAVAGLPVVVREAPTGGIQFAYADLNDLDKARVDAESDKIYSEKSEEYEYKLGLRLSNADPVVEIVNQMLTKVKAIVDAWARHTKQKTKKVYAQEFRFKEGDKYYGAFDPSGSAIEKVFNSLNSGPLSKSQPIRKKLKIIYNAVRNNNLAKWLKVAADELVEAQRLGAAPPPVRVRRANDAVWTRHGIDWSKTKGEKVSAGFAHDSGLETVLNNDPALFNRVKEALLREKQDFTKTAIFGPDRTFKVHVAAPDMWSNLARGTKQESSKIDKANKDRLYNQNRGASYKDQRTLKAKDIPDLTAAEVRMLKSRGEAKTKDKTKFKSHPDNIIAWEQGRDAIVVFANSRVEQMAEQIGARLEAGISGSTNMMFVAAKNIGITNLPDLQKLRLAMLGWMLPNHDHSFFEIMKAADIQGVPFVTDPMQKGYHYQAPANYLPMDVNSFKDILPENEFPMYFLSPAYKDQLAVTFDTQDMDNPPTVADYQARIRGWGIPNAEITQLNKRGLVEMIALHDRIQRAAFKDETIGTAKQKESAKAANFLQFRYIRESSAYRYLVHTYPIYAERWFAQLLSNAGKPLAPDHAQLLGLNSAHLPSLSDDINARRTMLTNLGIASSLLKRENVVNDLLQLSAFIQGLPLDGTKGFDDPANKPSIDQIWQLQIMRRLAASLRWRVARTCAGQLLRRHHGEQLYRSLLFPELASPAARNALAAGVPENIVRALFRQKQDLIPHLTRIINDIINIGSRPPATQIAALKSLRATYAELATFLDTLGSNRFDLVVAGIASQQGIDLSSDQNLKTLGIAAKVLHPGSTIVLPGAPYTAGFQQFGIDAARDTLDQNLLNEGRALAATPFAALTPVEVAAINAYTKLGGMGGGGATSWQDNLSKLDLSKSGSDALKKTAPKMEAAISGLRKLPTYNGIVYSGTWSGAAPLTEQVLRTYPVGSIHYKDNFLSTAKRVDASFIPKANYHVAWVIDGVKTGKDIQALSTNYGEEEVLFPPGAKFMVTKVKDYTADPAKHNKVWVYLVEL